MLVVNTAGFNQLGTLTPQLAMPSKLPNIHFTNYKNYYYKNYFWHDQKIIIINYFKILQKLLLQINLEEKK